MSDAIQRSVDFATKFNSLIGANKARPITVTELNNSSLNMAQAADLINRLKKTSSAKQAVAPQSVNVAKPKAVKAAKAIPPADYRAQNFNTLLNGKPALQANVSGPGVLDTLTGNSVVKAISDLANASGGKNEQLGKELTHPPGFITRPVDVISRPAYAVDEALNQVAKNIGKGQSLKDSVLNGDILTGLREGITGRKKTGFGQVVQSLEDPYLKGENPQATSFLPDFLNGPKAIAKEQMTHPELAKWSKRAIGITGSIATDPLTYLSGGSEQIIRGGEEGLKGSEALSQLIKDSLPKIAEGIPVEKLTARAVSETGMNAKNIPLAQKIATNTAEHVGNNLITDINAGMKSGTSLGMEEAVKNATTSIATQAYTGMLENLDKNATKFLTGKIGPAKLSMLKAEDPVFDAWHEAIQSLDKADPGFLDQSSKIMQDVVERHTADVYAKAQEALTNKILKVPTLEIMGKKIVSLEKVGEAIHAIKTGNLPGSERSLQEIWRSGFGKAFSHNANFPGITFLMESHQRTLGVRQFEKEAATLFHEFSGTNADLREALGKHLGTGTDSGHAAQQALQQAYKDAWDREAAVGLKDAKHNPYNPNYTYTHVTGPEEKVKKFYDLQKSRMQAPGGYFDGVAEAKSLGLKPETDSYKNFLYRNAESHRAVSQARYIHDLAVNYGIPSKLSSAEAAKMDLKPLTNETWLKGPLSTLKPGETMYLDKEIHSTIDAVKKLMSGGLPDDIGMKKFVQSLDNITKKFKTWNTVYFPGYHVKNFLSDMYIGALDGVGPRDYTSILNILHKDAAAPIEIGGRIFTKQEFKNLYDEYASAGFISTETGLGGNTISKSVRKAAEWREDLGRMAHFYHALNEELPPLLQKLTDKTPTALDQTLEKASKAAAFRVNKFKFDFSALAPTERNIIRRGVPFYTYARKAIPVILESALLNPKVLSYTNQITNALGSGDAGKNNILPQWLRDIGYSEVIGGNKPWGITDDFTANPTLEQLRPDKAADQLNPLIQGLIELKTNKDSFSGKKITGGLLDPARVLNKLRIAQVVNKGVSNKSSRLEQLYQLAGVPIRQVNGPRAKSARQSMIFDLKAQLKALSSQHKGFKIYLSESQAKDAIKIKDPTGLVIDQDFTSIKEAKDWLKAHNA